MDLGQEEEDGEEICMLQAKYFLPVMVINIVRIMALRRMNFARIGHLEI